MKLSERCDGVQQCSSGKDEMGCSFLTSKISEKQVNLPSNCLLNLIISIVFSSGSLYLKLRDISTGIIKDVGTPFVPIKIHGSWIFVSNK